jgi:HrpA-like RNA helicase
VRRYTHVILDEAHERSSDQDFLCLVLKRLLFPSPASGGEGKGGQRRRGAAAGWTRLVVMSATLQSTLFGEYFRTPDHDDEDNDDDEEPIFVGAGRFPVEIFYADDIAEGCMAGALYKL